MYVLAFSGLMDGRMDVYASSMRSHVWPHTMQHTRPPPPHCGQARTLLTLRKCRFAKLPSSMLIGAGRRMADDVRRTRGECNKSGSTLKGPRVRQLPSNFYPLTHMSGENVRPNAQSVKLIKSGVVRSLTLFSIFVFNFVDQSSTGIHLNLVAAILSG